MAEVVIVMRREGQEYSECEALYHKARLFDAVVDLLGAVTQLVWKSAELVEEASKSKKGGR